MNSKLYIFKSTSEHHMLLNLHGCWSVYQGLPDIKPIIEESKKQAVTKITCSLENVQTWDSVLILFVNKLHDVCKQANIEIEFEQKPKGFQALVELIDKKTQLDKPSIIKSSMTKSLDIIESIRNIFTFKTINAACEFVGMITISLVNLTKGKTNMQSRDLIINLRNCGPSSLPIITLTSLLIGMILAYVGLLQLKEFGAEIYIAALVSIGMSREMGPLIVAVIMSGKVGATYAAELGTMQVNEEIDALKTMGISIYDYLVIPRLLALILVIPVMNLYATFLGLFGGSLIALSQGIVLEQYWKYASDAVGFSDFYTGTIKSIVFGVIIASCGCYQGVRSGRNSAAVGKVTTKAVVFSIVFIIVADATLTITYNKLGI